MAFIAIPARRIYQQQVDGLEAPRGLFGQGIRYIGDFAFIGGNGIAVGTPSVVGGGAGQGHDDEHADDRDTKL